MRGRMDPVHAALLREVRALVAADAVLGRWVQAGRPSLAVESWDTSPWASLTFEGRRHTLRVRLEGPADAVEAAHDRLEALLESPPIQLAGHWLLELVLGESEAEALPDGLRRVSVMLEGLTVRD